MFGVVSVLEIGFLLTDKFEFESNFTRGGADCRFISRDDRALSGNGFRGRGFWVEEMDSVSDLRGCSSSRSLASSSELRWR